MHGDTHVYDKFSEKKDYFGHGSGSEFFGHTYDIQVKKIKNGLNKFKNEGQLPADYNPDKFQWTKANLKNLVVPPEELEAIRKKAWNDCNSEAHKKSRLKWSVPN